MFVPFSTGQKSVPWKKIEKKNEPLKLTDSEHGMLMLTSFCDVVSNSDTRPSSNYRFREAVFAFFGNSDCGKESLEFHVTLVQRSRSSLAVLIHQRELPGGGEISRAASKSRKLGLKVV